MAAFRSNLLPLSTTPLHVVSERNQDCPSACAFPYLLLYSFIRHAVYCLCDILSNQLVIYYVSCTVSEERFIYIVMRIYKYVLHLTIALHKKCFTLSRLHISKGKTYHQALVHMLHRGKYLSTRQYVIDCVLRRRSSVANTSSANEEFLAFYGTQMSFSLYWSCY